MVRPALGPPFPPLNWRQRVLCPEGCVQCRKSGLLGLGILASPHVLAMRLEAVDDQPFCGVLLFLNASHPDTDMSSHSPAVLTID